MELPKETRISPEDVTENFIKDPNINYFLAYKT